MPMPVSSCALSFRVHGSETRDNSFPSSEIYDGSNREYDSGPDCGNLNSDRLVSTEVSDNIFQRNPSHTTPTAYGSEKNASLPRRVRLGVANIQKYRDPRVVPEQIIKTVYVPLPNPGMPSQILDTNIRRFDERCPDMFVLGDGGTSRAFIGVDQRPGSPLDTWLKKLIDKIPHDIEPATQMRSYNKEIVLPWLCRKIGEWIDWTPGSSFNDGRAEFEWDHRIQLFGNPLPTFQNVVNEPVQAPPTDTGLEFPVVPFENFLEKGQGYCLQKALLGALILDRIGIPARLINGAIAQGPGTSGGHTWLELADGKVFDPAWGIYGEKGHYSDTLPGHFSFGGVDRFASERYPYLRIMVESSAS